MSGAFSACLLNVGGVGAAYQRNPHLDARAAARLHADLLKGQIWQVRVWMLIIDAWALVTAEGDLEEGLHTLVWESYDWWT